MTDFLKLKFDGTRFKGGNLDVDALAEIVTYKNAITRLAAHMQLQEHGVRRKGVRRELRLALVGEIGEGSACATIARVGQLQLEEEDLFAKARDRLGSVLHEADEGDRRFTHEDVLALSVAKNIGTTLRPDERLFIARPRDKNPHAKVTKKSNEAIQRAFHKLRAPHHAHVAGRIFAVDTKNRTFSLDTPAGGTIDGRYLPNDPAIEQAIAQSLGHTGYVLVSGMMVSKIEGSSTRADLTASSATLVREVAPDFELKMARLLRGPDIDKGLANRCTPYIREMVWERGLPAPVVFLSDDNGFSLEWSLPGPWEVSVDFDQEAIIGDTTNPVTGESHSFELPWSDVGSLVARVLVLFEESGWKHQ